MKNKEGLWKFSPSGLYNFDQCKSCFWVENHCGKGPSMPWLLNTAMDSVLKARYDYYRKEGSLPPEANILELEGMKPYEDIELLTQFRNSTSVLKVTNTEDGYELAGKLDEILVGNDGLLIPTDFKSSGYAPKADKQKYYVSQLSAYALMLQYYGLAVGKKAMLLHYFVEDVNNTSLEVKFALHMDPVEIDLAGFRTKLASMVELLNAPYPGYNNDCASCTYHLKSRQ